MNTMLAMRTQCWTEKETGRKGNITRDISLMHWNLALYLNPNSKNGLICLRLGTLNLMILIHFTLQDDAEDFSKSLAD